MKKFLSLAILLFLSACQNTPVATDYDTATDFSSYHDYVLAWPDKTDNDLMQKRLMTAVSKHIELLGLQTSNNKPSLIIKPSIQTQQRTQAPSSRGGLGLGSGGGGSFFGLSLSIPLGSETLVNDVLVAIAMFDSESKQQLWQGHYAFSIAADKPDEADQMVDKAVAAILGQYPPPAAQ